MVEGSSQILDITSDKSIYYSIHSEYFCRLLIILYFTLITEGNIEFLLVIKTLAALIGKYSPHTKMLCSYDA